MDNYHTEDEILIIGAGPAGLAAGLELTKQGKKVLIIEKENQVGGLAKTLQFGKFRTDIGPHRFFSQNQYLSKMISNLLGQQWQLVNRLTHFYIKGKLYRYPIQLGEVLIKTGLYKSFRMFIDYLGQKLKSLLTKQPPKSFGDYIIKNFGRTLSGFNMLPYTEKLWGLSVNQISADWATQRIKGLSVWSAIKKALIKTSSGPKTLVDQFYYPKQGTGLIYEAMAQEIKRLGGEIWLNSEPIKIHHQSGIIQEIMINQGGQTVTVKPTHLLSSMPITELIKLFTPPVPAEILDYADKLKFRAHLGLFITVNQPLITKNNWIYFPNKEIPFCRIAEMKNFSSAMAPVNQTSLFVEYFVNNNDDLWQKGAQEIFTLTMPCLEKLGLSKQSDVLEYYLHKEEFAYPIYDLTYQDNLRPIKNWLNQFTNLLLIGRGGRFRYTNQDHSLEMGILASQTILTGQQYDLDKPGSEQEYFERGTYNR